MGGYEFVAKMTESLAWPIVVLAAIIVFRAEVRKGLARIRKVDAFGISTELQEMEQVEIETGVPSAPDGPRGQRVGPGEQRAAAPNAVPEADLRSPPLTIVEEWNSFQNYVFDIYPRIVDPVPQVILVQEMFDQLGRAGLLTSAQVDAVKAAIGVRNKVVHGEHIPTHDEALRFRTALRRLRAFIEHRLPPQ